MTVPVFAHRPGAWLNGVNVANTPTFPMDGKCRTCGERIKGIETSMTASAKIAASPKKIDPPNIKGPYYVPCGHDAADAFGGRC